MKEKIIEPIQNALYSTEKFTTDECTELAEGILIYLKDYGYMIVKEEPTTDEPTIKDWNDVCGTEEYYNESADIEPTTEENLKDNIDYSSYPKKAKKPIFLTEGLKQQTTKLRNETPPKLGMSAEEIKEVSKKRFKDSFLGGYTDYDIWDLAFHSAINFMEQYASQGGQAGSQAGSQVGGQGGGQGYYRKVKCSERLPNDTDWKFVILNDGGTEICHYNKWAWYVDHCERYHYSDEIEYWLEEIKEEQK